MLSTWMLAALAGALSADAGVGANWHADYADALAETKQEDHPLLVVIDKPSEEGKQFDPELLKQADAEAYALCHIDASTEYGKKVAEGFKVTEFPHVAIIDKSGSVILRRIKGEVTADQWTAALKAHQNGERSGRTRYTVAKPVVSTPATTYTPTFQPAVSYPTAQPYCPSCQLRNR